MKLFMALVISAMTLSTATHAEQNGMFLKEQCAKGEPTGPFAVTQASVTAYAHGQWCYGFITGYFDFYKGDIKAPEGVSVEQLRLVLMRYLNTHPEVLHLSADELLLRAVLNGWSKK
jgi:Rap1a immunity proteins